MTNPPASEDRDSPLVRGLRKAALAYAGIAVLVLVLTLMPFHCSNPLPFGPGRVAVNLDRATVRAVDHAVLFREPRTSPDQKPSRQVLELRISSRTDLLGYLGGGGRHLQVRCDVVGNTNGRRYRDSALGPFPGKAPAGSLVHRYTIDAFMDLQASDVEYEGGKPASTLDLKSSVFHSLRCHLVGVTMGPAFWPRSNDLVVTAAQFRALVDNGQSRDAQAIR